MVTRIMYITTFPTVATTLDDSIATMIVSKCWKTTPGLLIDTIVVNRYNSETIDRSKQTQDKEYYKKLHFRFHNSL